jgi:hypothetical protein
LPVFRLCDGFTDFFSSAVRIVSGDTSATLKVAFFATLGWDFDFLSSSDDEWPIQAVFRLEWATRSIGGYFQSLIYGV